MRNLECFRTALPLRMNDYQPHGILLRSSILADCYAIYQTVGTISPRGIPVEFQSNFKRAFSEIGFTDSILYYPNGSEEVARTPWKIPAYHMEDYAGGRLGRSRFYIVLSPPKGRGILYQ